MTGNPRVNGWTAILPVKPWNLAKTRLGLSHDDRVQVARAFALDALDALVGSTFVSRIVVVTAEHRLVGHVARVPGALVLADRPMMARDMLNPAVDLARRWGMAHAPRAPIVVVPADLAALTPDVLDEAIARLACYERAFIPDTEGDGTTLVAARRPSRLVTLFGPRSASRHAGEGVHMVADVDPRVRRDVDRPDHVSQARHLGFAAHTAAVVGGLMSRR